MKTIGGLLVSSLVTILSLLLIVAGLFFVYRTNDAQAMSVQPSSESYFTTTHQEPDYAAVPSSLSIASLNIYMKVESGTFNAKEGQWELNDSDAFYAHGTTTPIIYAHNRNGMFANLKNIKHEGILTLAYPDGSIKNYAYKKNRFVSPSDGGVLQESNDSTIILLTCEGLFSESRRLTYFEEIQS